MISKFLNVCLLNPGKRKGVDEARVTAYRLKVFV